MSRPYIVKVSPIVPHVLCTRCPLSPKNWYYRCYDYRVTGGYITSSSSTDNPTTGESIAHGHRVAYSTSSCLR